MLKYYDIDEDTCVACHSLCENCNGINKDNCLTCKSY